MIKVDESIFTPFFDWCNSNEDSEVDREEFIFCSEKGSQYFQYSDDMPYQNYIYGLVEHYRRLVDDDYRYSSWPYKPLSLSFDEFKYIMAGLASVDAGVILKVR